MKTSALANTVKRVTESRKTMMPMIFLKILAGQVRTNQYGRMIKVFEGRREGEIDCRIGRKWA